MAKDKKKKKKGKGSGTVFALMHFTAQRWERSKIPYRVQPRIITIPVPNMHNDEDEDDLDYVGTYGLGASDSMPQIYEWLAHAQSGDMLRLTNGSVLYMVGRQESAPESRFTSLASKHVFAMDRVDLRHAGRFDDDECFVESRFDSDPDIEEDED
jgi:hypothetical protein